MSKYIAEVGLNHLGDSKLCLKMINKALSCGVDGISLQIFPRNYYDNSQQKQHFPNQLILSCLSNYVKWISKKFGFF